MSLSHLILAKIRRKYSRLKRFLGLQKELEIPTHLQPLNEVDWLLAKDSLLKEDEAVLGLMLDGQAWALSWRQLSHHHIANLDINGVPVLFSWCGMCSAGAAFSRHIDGKELCFAPAATYNGTYAIEDDVFNRTWHPFSGKIISKTGAAKHLEQLDLTQCTWDEWLQMNPNTYVAHCLDKEVFGHSLKPGGMKLLGQKFKKSIIYADDSLPEMEMVLGLMLEKSTYAFRMSELSSGNGVYECTLNQQDIVIFSSQDSWLVRASFNRVGGKKLSFYADPAGYIYDKETGSQWDYMGKAIQGELQGEVLERCPSSIQAWYAWATEHPNTTLCDMKTE